MARSEEYRDRLDPSCVIVEQFSASRVDWHRGARHAVVMMAPHDRADRRISTPGDGVDIGGYSRFGMHQRLQVASGRVLHRDLLGIEPAEHPKCVEYRLGNAAVHAAHAGLGTGLPSVAPLHVLYSQRRSAHGVQGTRQRSLRLQHLFVEM